VGRSQILHAIMTQLVRPKILLWPAPHSLLSLDAELSMDAYGIILCAGQKLAVIYIIATPFILVMNKDYYANMTAQRRLAKP
jgi:hypothetical protein